MIKFYVFLYRLERVIFDNLSSLTKRILEAKLSVLKTMIQKCNHTVQRWPSIGATWETKWRDDRRPSIRARWKQSKRFNFRRHCNITVLSEMESQPLGYSRRPDVSRHAAGSFSLATTMTTTTTTTTGDPFLIVREGNGGIPAHRTHTRLSHALRMNLYVLFLGLGLRNPILYR